MLPDDVTIREVSGAQYASLWDEAQRDTAFETHHLGAVLRRGVSEHPSACCIPELGDAQVALGG